MFEVGFSEMLVIAVVALIVIGPERLPKVARTLGHLWGRAKRYVNSVKADISRDMALEELRQMQQKVQQEADAATSALRQTSQQLDQQVHQFNSTLMQPVQNVAQEIQGVGKTASVEPKIHEQQKLPID